MIIFNIHLKILINKFISYKFLKLLFYYKLYLIIIIRVSNEITIHTPYALVLKIHKVQDMYKN